MRSIVRSLLKMFGYEIRKINPPSEVEQGLIIKSTEYHNTRDGMNVFYDNPKMVKNYLVKERLEWYDQVIDLCKEKKILLDNKNICDVGCGPGDVLNKIQQQYNAGNLTGFDHSDKAIEVAQKRFPNISFKQFDIYSDFKEFEQVYDVIFCLEVIEHLLHPKQGVINVLTMLKQTGIAIITVPNGRPDTYTGHINFWSPESWQIFIESISQNDYDCDIGLINNEANNTNYAILYKKQVV
jgi:SAM-dependent methyltransferase